MWFSLCFEFKLDAHKPVAISPPKPGGEKGLLLAVDKFVAWI